VTFFNGFIKVIRILTMKNWKALLVRPETAIADAIKVLDKGGQRIVIVTDVSGRLLGTVTDGDVRRALIYHVSMDLPVEQIMCKTPRSAKSDWNRERALATMEKYQLLQLPIIDDNDRIIGVETLYEVCKPHYNNPVLLIAGGLGTRLHPLTLDCPKPLLKVGDKPILELILERFINAGFHRFFISTHFKSEMIREHFGDGRKWGSTINYVYEDKPLGTGGALGLLPHEEIDLPLIMMNGDLLTNLNFEHLLSFHEEHANIATMCVREYKHSVPYGVIQSIDHQVVSMVEKPTHRFFINAGVYVFSPELVKSCTPGVHIDTPTLLEQQIAMGKKVNMFPIHEYWLDIGRMEDFQLAQNEYAGL
jgi:dTDP-glucose pyrophosphorylase/CBS domain-containing protein